MLRVVWETSGQISLEKTQMNQQNKQVNHKAA